ncbi:MAG: UDP-N-acetylmuramoyl-L-alanyl-D-glutamate--2,6-diaminopimelate ligase [Acidimicrobiia bacterium]|nr:MAG: UDP-N-acetylmuramoyl-L-alanyl-D-glutamate--2,6-diaminopimelate ligase [Acidimicrobiia bacterium]
MAGHGVTLGAVAASLEGVRSISGPDVTITSITHDSRKVGPGVLFVAIAGQRSDGHDFASAAVAAGASGLLLERPVEYDVGQIIVPDTRVAMAWAARTVYGEPDLSLEIVGVTGTNGKTTVSHMCESIWHVAGRRTGLIGTLGARIGGEPIPIERTTPEATELQELLGTMRDQRVEVVAMEVSSHAIALHRAEAIAFAVVAFTNLSQDHLDFHRDMDAYLEAKASLFTSGRARASVINIDDPYGRRVRDINEIPGLTVGSGQDSDVRITDVRDSAAETNFVLHHSGKALSIRIPLIGSFNVSNAALAGAIAISTGVDPAAIADGLANVPVISGRMEVIDHPGPFTVIVDYAHTPDAISEVLQAAKAAATGRVIAVIGAAGDRDRAKRSLMGAAAVRFADITVITSDNPRSEDPATIAGEVQRGADAVPGSNARTVLDRREAIVDALSMARHHDIVLILGKGHEQGIEAHGVLAPFDDRVEAKAALNALGWETP